MGPRLALSERGPTQIALPIPREIASDHLNPMIGQNLHWDPCQKEKNHQRSPLEQNFALIPAQRTQQAHD
jgi:hypothetical protein